MRRWFVLLEVARLVVLRSSLIARGAHGSMLNDARKRRRELLESSATRSKNSWPAPRRKSSCVRFQIPWLERLCSPGSRPWSTIWRVESIPSISSAASSISYRRVPNRTGKRSRSLATAHTPQVTEAVHFLLDAKVTVPAEPLGRLAGVGGGHVGRLAGLVERVEVGPLGVPTGEHPPRHPEGRDVVHRRGEADVGEVGGRGPRRLGVERLAVGDMHRRRRVVPGVPQLEDVAVGGGRGREAPLEVDDRVLDPGVPRLG